MLMDRQGGLIARQLLGRPDFRRLLVVRMLGQFADGVFQASLAGTILFNPERQAHAADIAAGFAVLLLPYSLLGPFAGVLLDRWSRQRVLLGANLFRALLVCAVARRDRRRRARPAVLPQRAGGDLGQPVRAVGAVGLAAARGRPGDSWSPPTPSRRPPAR